MRRWSLILLVLLSACGKLPAPETAAFKTLAETDRDSFAATVNSERDATAARALDQAADGQGKIRDVGCKASDLGRTCDLVVDAHGQTIPLTLQAPESRELITAIALYGGAMAELAAATDLATLNAKIDGVATAIAGLAAATGVAAPAAPITKLVAAAIKAGLKDKRRQLLLRAAEQAQPIVARAALSLSRQTAALKTIIVVGAGPRLTTARLDLGRLSKRIAAISRALDRLPPTADEREQTLLQARSVLQARAAYLVRDEITAAAQINAARSMSADFSSLEKGHAAIVTALRSDKPDLGESLTQLQSFASTVKELKTSL